MPSVCLYFQMHQPHRLRRYSVFDTEQDYFDHNTNRAILEKVVSKCYLPATQLLLDLVRKHDGDFRFAFSLTGVLMQQLQKRHPEVLVLLKKLAATGCVEFLSETYHHSLAFLYSREEFMAQVAAHDALIQEHFGQKPRVFRNTELIYSNELAMFLAEQNRYAGILCEGVDQILGNRSPNHLYHAPGVEQLKLLPKNYRLSDDIAFRFSDRNWPQWPLTADKFARAVETFDREGEVCNLFMDYETFGEHQWAETGIFDFLRALPTEVLKRSDFKTPIQCIEAYPSRGELDVPNMTSWADTERDLSAWLGNAMQSSAMHELYRLEPAVKQTKDAHLLEDWRKLTCSDHFYYMCTKYFGDGAVHRYFNPYQSPYDSYINFMNVLDNIRTRIEELR